MRVHPLHPRWLNVACAAWMSLYIAAAPVAHAQSAVGNDAELNALERLDNLALAQTRQACADGDMPAIKRRMDTNKTLRHFDGQMSEVSVYCLKVIAVSKAKGQVWDVYINIALQEQGYGHYHFADQAALLKNHEAARTWEAILRAANAGQTTYTSITGKSRPLPCPLALDAGATWASSNAKAAAPVALTQAEATAIALQCYNPAVTTITLRGTTMPAQKAGLIAGIWLARQG